MSEAGGSNEVERRVPAILVAEDDPAVRKVIGATLQRSGYEVVLARSAADARSICAKVPVDLLIADVVLPDTPGPVLAEECHKLRSNLRVLFISGYGAEQLAERGVSIDRVLEKPFTPALLRAKVEEILAELGSFPTNP